MIRATAIVRLGFILLSLVAAQAAQTALGGETDLRISTGEFSAHWSPDEWNRMTTSAVSDDYASRPSEHTLAAITVEWQQPQRDVLGNLCIVRGRLVTPGDEQADAIPVNWHQGITVYLAKVPGAKPDWSTGMDQADTLSATAVADPAGEFEVRIDLRKAQQDRTRPQHFQFGLALAEHAEVGEKRQRVVWSSHAPAVGATVRTLEIPAAAKLSRELELINRASGWPFSNSNGVVLIRAVNALQPLGKQQALATLEEYVAATNTFDDSGEQDIVFWIVRTLFEPIQLDDRIPAPMIAVHLEKSANWPLNPLAIVEDIPFMIGRQTGMGGMPEHPSEHIAWARRHGVIRDQPLRPTANPLLAARAILGSQAFLQLDRSSRAVATRLLRLQALSMVADTLPAELTQHDDDRIERRQWRALIQDAQTRPIRWDVEREEFVEKGE